MKKLISVLNKFSGNKIVSVCDNIKLDNGIATLSNLENFVTFPIAYGGNNGLIDWEFLKKIVSKNENFSLNLTENFGEIISGKSKFKTPKYDMDDFPNLPEGKNFVGNITIDSEFKTLKNFLSNDELRPQFTGVLFDFEKSEFVSTNAHILKWVKIGGEIQKGIKGRVIVNKTVFDIPNDNYSVYLSDNKEYIILQNTNNYNFYFRLIDAIYPDVSVVIPKDNPISISLNKKDLLEALEGSLLACNRTTYAIKLECKENKVTIHSVDIDYSQEFSFEFSDIQNTDDIEIGFNSRFLNTIVKDIKADTINFALSTPNRAGIINGNCLIMSLMLN